MKKKDRYPDAKHHIAASAVSVIGMKGSPASTLPPLFLLTRSSSSRRSSRSADGVPHQMAGRMEHRRRAKSQGCHGRGTLRTTATRGWRREARWATSVAFGGLAADAGAAEEEEDDSFTGGRVGDVGDDGTEEARL